jgi:hypothetical protein
MINRHICKYPTLGALYNDAPKNVLRRSTRAKILVLRLPRIGVKFTYKRHLTNDLKAIILGKIVMASTTTLEVMAIKMLLATRDSGSV